MVQPSDNLFEVTERDTRTDSHGRREEGDKSGICPWRTFEEKQTLNKTEGYVGDINTLRN
jgi:hypothetical protein